MRTPTSGSPDSSALTACETISLTDSLGFAGAAIIGGAFSTLIAGLVKSAPSWKADFGLGIAIPPGGVVAGSSTVQPAVKARVRASRAGAEAGGRVIGSGPRGSSSGRATEPGTVIVVGGRPRMQTVPGEMLGGRAGAGR